MKKGDIIEIRDDVNKSVIICSGIVENEQNGFFLIIDSSIQYDKNNIQILGYKHLDKVSDLVNSVSHFDDTQFYTSIKYDTFLIPLKLLSGNYRIIDSVDLNPKFYPRPNFNQKIQNLSQIYETIIERLTKKGSSSKFDNTIYNSYPLKDITIDITMKFIVITGPPYSGKGTQCEELVKEYGFTHISTGEHIRKEKETKSTLGQIMSDYDEKGELVPDKTMKLLLEKILQDNLKSSGIILDGYPRTIAQVKDLVDVLRPYKIEIDNIINIEVPIDELLKRAKKRAETSTREDDKNPETHYKRIRVFEEQTKPTIEYMKKEFRVTSFSGLGKIEEITERIKASI